MPYRTELLSMEHLTSRLFDFYFLNTCHKKMFQIEQENAIWNAVIK
jgi:hypothetical protein